MNHSRGALPLTLALLASLTTPIHAQNVSTVLADYAVKSWSEKDGLPSSPILAITQDTGGYLWLGTIAGLVRFDGVRFVPADTFVQPALPTAGVLSFASARDGSIWVGFDNSNGVSRIQNGRANNYGKREGVDTTVTGLVEGRDGTIWATGHYGLAIMQERAEAAGGQFTIASAPGQGTKVEAAIPTSSSS